MATSDFDTVDNHFVTLRSVLGFPQRLEIGVVTGFQELLTVGEVEAGERDDVVEFPLGPVIVPRHSRGEHSLEVGFKFLNGTAEVTNG